jgi:hypothetical protein
VKINVDILHSDLLYVVVVKYSKGKVHPRTGHESPEGE